MERKHDGGGGDAASWSNIAAMPPSPAPKERPRPHVQFILASTMCPPTPTPPTMWANAVTKILTPSHPYWMNMDDSICMSYQSGVRSRLQRSIADFISTGRAFPRWSANGFTEPSPILTHSIMDLPRLNPTVIWFAGEQLKSRFEARNPEMACEELRPDRTARCPPLNGSHRCHPRRQPPVKPRQETDILPTCTAIRYSRRSTPCVRLRRPR